MVVCVVRWVSVCVLVLHHCLGLGLGSHLLCWCLYCTISSCVGVLVICYLNIVFPLKDYDNIRPLRQ